ncbi:MAG: amino acid racemase [Lentilactobacillus hilgardii]|uniref:aspartate/glutamate racemase family protein n=1 Tax=Lentilactobacillus hilgardii TaxID=1588 RepID=UPI001CC20D7F|nr:amino acid racemase [Lentilactobacillus hilgardii]MBZ2201134.1 aspartate racemase [Lentilactobacillus hilgardii]MBZ2203615.1 aspartate racemase [Lentilactobacillus hilgardii]
MKNFFTIIGGMGTEATELFIHILNERTPAKKDQEYLNYILVNHSTIPDRTDYILDHSKPNPFIPLAEDIKQQSQLDPDFFVIPCNTAHYSFDDLQALTSVPILHMPRETVKDIKHDVPSAKRVGLIATRGTLHDGIYDREIRHAGYDLVKPDEKTANQTMELIYNDIKEKNQVDGDLYHQILSTMVNKFSCDVVILGCTELSVAQQRAGDHSFPVIDAQTVLAKRTIELALKNRGVADKQLD